MIEHKADFAKGGLLMGAILGIVSTLSITINSMETVMSFVSIATIFFFPISMGIKYRRNIADDISFGFGEAYKYSFIMMFIGSAINTIVYIAVVMIVGKEVLAEQLIAELMETGMAQTQQSIELISNVYKGNSWMFLPVAGAILSPAIYALPSAYIIRKKEA